MTFLGGAGAGMILPAVRGARSEDAELAAEREARGGQDGGQAGEELERRHDERGPAVAIRPLQAVHDDAVVSQGEALQAQRGPQEVADEALERGAIARRHDDAGVDVDALGDGAERRVAGAGPRRLVGGDRQGGLLPFAVAEAEGNLDAAGQRVGGFRRRRLPVGRSGQPAAMEHLREPAGDPVGEGCDLVQRGGRRGFEPERTAPLPRATPRE